MLRNDRCRVSLYVLIATVLFLFIKPETGFFWDNVMQLSVPANWYFDNDFSSIFVPDSIATGHPPTISLYLALWWKVLGRSLTVSHLAFTPFVIGIIWQILILMKLSGLRLSQLIPVLILLMADPTLMSQMTLLTFELPMLFFFLLCINSIIRNNRGLLVASFALLCITSLRGTMCGLGVIIFFLLYNKLILKKPLWNQIRDFLPGTILFVAFLIWFYLEKGWVVHNTVSDRWPVSSEMASLKGVLRNSGIFVWRLVDFGRIGIWLFLFYVLLRNGLKGMTSNSNINVLALVAAAQAVVFVPVLIMSANSIAHRYLLTITVPVGLIAGILIMAQRKVVLTYLLVLGLLISGSFWVYPEKIAQGWDATPAHWPYYKLRKEMLGYLSEANIPIEDTGSFFPFNFPTYYTDLSGDRLSTREANTDTDDFIIYSNVFNIDDETIDELFSSGNWKVKKKVTRGSVYITLYQKIH